MRHFQSFASIILINRRNYKARLGRAVTDFALERTSGRFNVEIASRDEAAGTSNPLNIQLNSSETIYANFSTNANSLVLYPVTRPGTADGVALDLNGQIGAHYRVDVSSNLLTWSNLYDLTNYAGTIHYIDSGTSNLNHRYYRAETVVP